LVSWKRFEVTLVFLIQKNDPPAYKPVSNLKSE
jgi:hypothetical protein